MWHLDSTVHPKSGFGQYVPQWDKWGGAEGPKSLLRYPQLDPGVLSGVSRALLVV